MFLKQSRLKPYPMRRFEKTVTETVRLELWPASSKLQSELYGERVNDILNANANKSATIKVKDGVCIDSPTEVTHKVISKKVYTHHQVLELERVRATRGR